MSLTEFNVIVEKKDVVVTVEPPRSATIEVPTTPGVIVLAAGNVGPPGPAGKWEAMTQNEYDLLNPPDPDTLYIIIQ
jgi:hypothetical protein